MRVSKRELKARALESFESLKEIYPPVTTFLTHDSPFQLLIAVILSAQCTDDRVNIVTPGLFAEFPDAVTSRGTKHLQKLKESIKKGEKPDVLFLTQIQGINNFRIAKDIDSTYYKEYLDAKKSGVNFLAYRCSLNSKEIKIEKKIKILDE